MEIIGTPIVPNDGATQYGAKLGRYDTPGNGENLVIAPVFLDDGGYDAGGAYWGRVSSALWRVFSLTEEEVHYVWGESPQKVVEVLGVEPSQLFRGGWYPNVSEAVAVMAQKVADYGDYDVDRLLENAAFCEYVEEQVVWETFKATLALPPQEAQEVIDRRIDDLAQADIYSTWVGLEADFIDPALPPEESSCLAEHSPSIPLMGHWPLDYDEDFDWGWDGDEAE